MAASTVFRDGWEFLATHLHGDYRFSSMFAALSAALRGRDVKMALEHV